NRHLSGKTLPSVVVTLPAECLHGRRAGTAPLRHGPGGRAIAALPVHVRTPRPGRLAPLGPTLRVVLPRLAAAVGRHVEQAHGGEDPFVAAPGRGVREEHTVAVAEEAGDATHVVADRRGHVAYRVP